MFRAGLGVGVLIWLVFPAFAQQPASTKTQHPLSKAERKSITEKYEAVLKANPAPEANSRAAVGIHSRRGDAYFFLSKFKESVKEYQAMVKIDANVDASHWRLGIALFFADKPKLAVAQFEKYHSFDDVDRENGIWRYLSQYKATDGETAGKELIRYAKDDREPFPAVYKLFDDSLSPQQALDSIPEQISEAERDKRLFYTELYIGMHMLVKKQKTQAKEFLMKSVSRQWPRTSGFGPNYMWHVGRVQLEELLREEQQKRSTAEKNE